MVRERRVKKRGVFRAQLRRRFAAIEKYNRPSREILYVYFPLFFSFFSFLHVYIYTMLAFDNILARLSFQPPLCFSLPIVRLTRRAQPPD